MTTSRSTGNEQAPPLLTARIIYGSLIAGVVMFTVVAGVMTGWGADPMFAEQPALGLFSAVWVALALGSIPLVLLFRGRAERAAGIDQPYQEAGSTPDPGAVQTPLVVAWAVVEGPALFGVIAFMMYGSAELLLGTLAAAAIGWGLGFPRRAYFEKVAA